VIEGRGFRFAAFFLPGAMRRRFTVVPERPFPQQKPVAALFARDIIRKY
jgi:hypothetical protein